MREIKPLPKNEDVHKAVEVLMEACHNRAWNAGWYHDLKTGEEKTLNSGERFMLMVSEISEAMEGDRKNLMDDKLKHRKMVPVELFDCVIRIFDYLGKYYPEDRAALVEKLEYNDSRADHKPENRVKEDGKKY
jgi:hypothetical protein